MERNIFQRAPKISKMKKVVKKNKLEDFEILEEKKCRKIHKSGHETLISRSSFRGN